MVACMAREETLHDEEEDRHEENRKRRGGDHPAHDACADGVAALRAGTGRDGQRQDADDEGERGHLYVGAATAIGLLISTFTRSQIAALFATALLSILPAVNFSGMIDPVSSLEGAGRVIGELYPTTHFLTIARGTFSKALGFADLRAAFVPLALAAPILLGLAAALLKKQER